MQDTGQFSPRCSVLAWDAGEPENATFQPRLAGTVKVFIEEGGSVQFSSFAQSCLTLRDPMDCSRPGFPAHHQLSEPTQTHVHLVGDAIQPSYPLSSPSPPAFNLSQHQGRRLG